MQHNSEDRREDRSAAQLMAERALTNALQRLRPETVIVNGRVGKLDDNLLPGISLSQFEGDFSKGAGGELEDKVRAPFSSSALVINHFAPFKNREPDFRIAGLTDFRKGTLEFEAKCPTGLEGTPPHLDVLISATGRVVGIEFKCIEHLAPTHSKFSPSYEKLLSSSQQSKPWLSEMMAIRAGQRQYRYLHAAQLIKHAFGLANCYATERMTLLYLFWEPSNAASIEELVAHRRELQNFERNVMGGSPRFQALTYRDLWAEWSTGPQPAWLADHVAALRGRYDVAI